MYNSFAILNTKEKLNKIKWEKEVDTKQYRKFKKSIAGKHIIEVK